MNVPYRHQHAKLAEAVLIEMVPMFSVEIRTVGARKGKSARIARYVASQLDGRGAAALAAAWSIRNARLAGIRSVFPSASTRTGFGSTLHRLLGNTEYKSLIRRIGWRRNITP